VITTALDLLLLLRVEEGATNPVQTTSKETVRAGIKRCQSRYHTTTVAHKATLGLGKQRFLGIFKQLLFTFASFHILINIISLPCNQNKLHN
jgi:hypothetical protein